MKLANLSEIEKEINVLSETEQLILIERMIHNLRKKKLYEMPLEIQLKTMADDPEIRKELHIIDKEFLDTESDGLA